MEDLFSKIRSHIYVHNIHTYSGPSLIRTSSIRQLRLSGLVLTIQLERFVESVLFIRVFECSSVYKCMGFNYLIFSVIWTHPGLNEFGQVRVRCT